MAEQASPEGSPPGPTPAPFVVTAFLLFAVIAGLNFIGVKFTVQELAPFWGAALRFAIAAALLAGYAWLRGLAWPKGDALKGAALFGLLSFALSYALAYYALTEVSAGLAAVIAATVPLLTLLFAALHRIERLTGRGLAGALIVLAGVAVILREQIGLSASVPHLAAAVLFPAAIAESNVVLKRYPRAHPVTTNALAMALGTALLLALSLGLREPIVLPRQTRTLLAVGYLILLGSIAMFLLYLFVLRRWTASATSYQMVLSPIVAVAAASWLAGESFSWNFAAGSVLVLLGVYVGVLYRPAPRPAPPPTPAADAAPQSDASETGVPRP